MEETVTTVTTASQTPITEVDILEKGLAVFRNVLSQKVSVNREEMVDLMNFEIVVANIINGAKAIKGKTKEEVMEMFQFSQANAEDPAKDQAA